MTNEEILSKCDHTILSVDAKWEQVQALCDDAIKYKTASICIAPAYVKKAKEYVADKVKICTVIGFPNGYSTTETKLFETENAIENGADEIDMVINIGNLKDKEYDAILYEINSLKCACKDKVLKVIIETCLLTEEEKVKMCEIITKSGADFIKTSTGFSTGGATKEDIKLFSAHIGENVKMKAAGGIKSLDDARDFIDLGCARLGTSTVVKLIKASENNG